MVDNTGPNNPSDKEKPEGSREDVNQGLEGPNRMEQGSGQISHPERPIPRQRTGGGSKDSGGIGNRPLSEEQDGQEELPPRGSKKEGGA